MQSEDQYAPPGPPTTSVNWGLARKLDPVELALVRYRKFAVARWMNQRQLFAPAIAPSAPKSAGANVGRIEAASDPGVGDPGGVPQRAAENLDLRYEFLGVWRSAGGHRRLCVSRRVLSTKRGKRRFLSGRVATDIDY